MQALDFNLVDLTILDVLNQTLIVIDLKLQGKSKQFMQKCVNYLTKMVQIDYNIQLKYNKIEQAAGIIKITFLMIKKLEYVFDIHLHVLI